MPTIVAAIHGILTGLTNPGWPEKFQEFMRKEHPEAIVITRKYFAGPFPRWNCWFENPREARILAGEIETLKRLNPTAEIWFVAHSNGAHIAMLAARELIRKGWSVAGLILTGAACDADVNRNGILTWIKNANLRRAFAYCSVDDAVVAGDGTISNRWFWRCRDFAWGLLIWPYGSLGRTGWLLSGRPFNALKCGPGDGPSEIVTRWFAGGHSTYFEPDRIDSTFRLVLSDIRGTPPATAVAVYNEGDAAKVPA